MVMVREWCKNIGPTWDIPADCETVRIAVHGQNPAKTTSWYRWWFRNPANHLVHIISWSLSLHLHEIVRKSHSIMIMWLIFTKKTVWDLFQEWNTYSFSQNHISAGKGRLVHSPIFEGWHNFQQVNSPMGWAVTLPSFNMVYLELAPKGIGWIGDAPNLQTHPF